MNTIEQTRKIFTDRELVIEASVFSREEAEVIVEYFQVIFQEWEVTWKENWAGRSASEEERLQYGARVMRDNFEWWVIMKEVGDLLLRNQPVSLSFLERKGLETALRGGRQHPAVWKFFDKIDLPSFPSDGWR